MAKPKSDKGKKRDFAGIAEQQIQDKQQSHEENGEEIVADPSGQRVLELPINDIRDNPNQPRKRFDEESLRELAESIEANGLLNPVLVSYVDGEYYLVGGERRLRACKRLGQETIKAIVVEVDPEIASLVDNIQREDLHPMERALAISRLYENYKKNSRKVAEPFQIGKHGAASAQAEQTAGEDHRQRGRGHDGAADEQ